MNRKHLYFSRAILRPMDGMCKVGVTGMEVDV